MLGATERQGESPSAHVEAELDALIADMKKMQQALFDVGLASLGTNIGHWEDRLSKCLPYLCRMGSK